MVKAILQAVVCCILVAGSLASTHKCYFCEVTDQPVGSDCWNQTASTAQVVNCDLPCYTQIFQSGGSSNPDNYWSIKRGCTGIHNDEEACKESNNCENRHFGACTTCCSSDLCNTGATPIRPLPVLIATFLMGIFVLAT